MYLDVVSKCVYDLTNAWSPFLQRHLNAASQNYMEFDPTQLYVSLPTLSPSYMCLVSHYHSVIQGSLVTSSNSMLLYILGIRMQYINKTIIVPLPEVGKKGGGCMRAKNQI